MRRVEFLVFVVAHGEKASFTRTGNFARIHTSKKIIFHLASNDECLKKSFLLGRWIVGIEINEPTFFAPGSGWRGQNVNDQLTAEPFQGAQLSWIINPLLITPKNDQVHRRVHEKERRGVRVWHGKSQEKLLVLHW